MKHIFIAHEQKSFFGKSSTTSGPFYQYGLTLIPAWISNHMPSKVWDWVTYPFLNFNSATIDV